MALDLSEPTTPVVHGEGIRTSLWRTLLGELRASPTAMAGCAVLVLLLVVAAVGPWLTPQAHDAVELGDRLTPPVFAGGSWAHPLGTDGIGRDILARMVVGTRMTVVIGVTVVISSGLVGTTLGILAGYHEGWFGALVMRIIDIELAFPALLLALAVLALYGPSPMTIIVVLTVNTWMIFGRITRDAVLAIRETTYVEAAETLGCPPMRVMLRYLLPNVAPLLLTLSTLEFARVVLAEASLSYLGFGIQPPSVSWGLMVAEGQQYIRTAWWIVTLPGLALSLSVLGINLVGSWLRVVTDPRQRGRGFSVATATQDAL